MDSERPQNIIEGTINSVSASFWYYLFKRRLNITLMGLLIGAVWMIGFGWLSFNSPGDNGVSWLFYLIELLPIGVIIVYCARVYSKTLGEFYYQFAQANNFIYTASGSISDLEGELFNIGHSRSMSNVVSGTYDGNDFDLFLYRYVTGSGKEQQTHHNTVCRINYPSPLPPIILLVDHEFFGGIIPLFSNWHKLKLEGNFDKNFDFYSRKEMEIEALQIFSPPVMEKLINQWPEFNLEFRDNQLIVFYNRTITTKAELERMYALVQYLITTVEPVALRMKSSLAAMNAAIN